MYAIRSYYGPFVSAEELAAMASDVRVAALVAGKPGIITIHTGIRDERLALIFAAVENHGIRAA